MNYDDKTLSVPYIVHEGVQVRLERIIKRLAIALVLAILLIFASNALWIWYMSGFDIETYDYVQDGVGVNIIGSKNGVDYNVPDFDYNEIDQKEKIEKEISSP